MNISETAILVVSFGTSSEQTGISAIEQLESRIRDDFPSYVIYRAWTSEWIRNRLLEQENQKINNVSEALNQMKEDGIRNIIVQPTFVIDGEENQRMRKEALVYAKDFSSMKFGAPLLGDEVDAKMAAIAVSQTVSASISYTKDDLVVFMGHGAAPDTLIHESMDWKPDPNAMYTLVDNFLQQSCHSNMVLRLMNKPGSIEEILALASSQQPRKIILVPFMIVAGRHAQKDMAGEQETSWASRLTTAGYSVQCIMKGLGEYDTIQEIFSEHIKRIL